MPIRVYKGTLNLASDFHLSKAKNLDLAALDLHFLAHEKGQINRYLCGVIDPNWYNKLLT